MMYEEETETPNLLVLFKDKLKYNEKISWIPMIEYFIIESIDGKEDLTIQAMQYLKQEMEYVLNKIANSKPLHNLGLFVEENGKLITVDTYECPHCKILLQENDIEKKNKFVFHKTCRKKAKFHRTLTVLQYIIKKKGALM